MSTLTACLLGWAAFAPALAPVPPDPPPDPLGRGYLGIWFSGSNPNGSLLIDRVEPHMPAAQAGLRAGDAIVRVNALHPETVQQVIDHVCSYRPGAVIEIEVRRGDGRKVYKVKLAVRPENPESRTPVPVPPPGFPDD